MSNATPDGWATLRRLYKYVADFKIGLIGAVIATLFYAGADALFIYSIQPLIDEGLADRNSTVLRIAPFFVMGVVLARGLFNFISSYGLAWVGSHVVMKLQQEVFDKMLTLPVSYFDQRSKGEMISSITYITTQVAQTCTKALVTVLREGAFALFLVCLMFYQSWMLSLSFLIIIPLIALLVRTISKRFRSVSRSIQKAMGSVTTSAEQMITGHKVVLTFGGQEREAARFGHATNMNRRQNMKLVAAEGLSVPVIQVLASTGLVVVLWMASSETMYEQLTPGVFTMIITSMIMLLKPLKSLSTVNSTFQKGVAAGQTLFELLDHPSETDTGTYAPERVKGHIQYKNVTFTYPRKSEPVLKDLSFEIQPGQTLALVGRSGSGKSTIASLLPRFYNIDDGQILIDGRDISEFSLKGLRQQFALVSQQVFLFNDTIANNIAYGVKKVSREAIVRAAEAARVTEFSDNMSEGLDTLIGENGVMLSGGQRQRVAIARAIFRDVPILILDEATSALDTESERFIQAALDELQKNRTALVIAHRLSTIENADCILVVEKGRVVESGTHDELIAKSGIYAQLHQLQFGEV